jgi:hypothetical protein
MSLPVLRKLHQLVQSGATLIGDKPVATPSLADDKQQFQTITDAMWSSGASYGKGKVVSAADAAAALQSADIAPDFDYDKPQPDTKLLFVHRRLANTDIYYIDNRNDRAEAVTASFRITGRAPELWHADTGRIEPASYTTTNGRTSVPLTLDPSGTVFVVFRKPATAPARTLPPKQEATLAPIEGQWKIAFEPNRGAPATITLDKLASLSENTDAGVKYFSGHATYTKTIDAPTAWFKPGAALSLDLGDVANLAEVKVNGKPLGITWKKPFRVDLTGALKPGSNTIEITVANLWVNRLIGDAQPDATTKYTFTTRNPYKANSKLQPSGLIGPVEITQTQTTSR